MKAKHQPSPQQQQKQKQLPFTKALTSEARLSPATRRFPHRKAHRSNKVILRSLSCQVPTAATKPTTKTTVRASDQSAVTIAGHATGSRRVWRAANGRQEGPELRPAVGHATASRRVGGQPPADMRDQSFDQRWGTPLLPAGFGGQPPADRKDQSFDQRWGTPLLPAGFGGQPPADRRDQSFDQRWGTPLLPAGFGGQPPADRRDQSFDQRWGTPLLPAGFGGQPPADRRDQSFDQRWGTPLLPAGFGGQPPADRRDQSFDQRWGTPLLPAGFGGQPPADRRDQRFDLRQDKPLNPAGFGGQHAGSTYWSPSTSFVELGEGNPLGTSTPAPSRVCFGCFYFRPGTEPHPTKAEMLREGGEGWKGHDFRVTRMRQEADREMMAGMIGYFMGMMGQVHSHASAAPLPAGSWGRLQPAYYEKAGAYELMRKLMVLHFLPAEHIRGAFDEMRQQTDLPLLVPLMEYMESEWLRNSVWTVEEWSVYYQPIRTNNDTEGYHTRLNRKAQNSLPFYLTESQYLHVAQDCSRRVCLCMVPRCHFQGEEKEARDYYFDRAVAHVFLLKAHMEQIQMDIFLGSLKSSRTNRWQIGALPQHIFNKHLTYLIHNNLACFNTLSPDADRMTKILLTEQRAVDMLRDFIKEQVVYILTKDYVLVPGEVARGPDKVGGDGPPHARQADGGGQIQPLTKMKKRLSNKKPRMTGPWKRTLERRSEEATHSNEDGNNPDNENSPPHDTTDSDGDHDTTDSDGDHDTTGSDVDNSAPRSTGAKKDPVTSLWPSGVPISTRPNPTPSTGQNLFRHQWDPASKPYMGTVRATNPLDLPPAPWICHQPLGSATSPLGGPLETIQQSSNHDHHPPRRGPSNGQATTVTTRVQDNLESRDKIAYMMQRNGQTRR
uniref:Uncharacterized protein n=1 Tax=Branchiostoma floridae TaxID=7739 RepID=C3XT11_BRAFL|eukprot:XP_002612735.1 hypothetical protein BRAFLDRAFT_97285 [Branchiostoma floridae]